LPPKIKIMISKYMIYSVVTTMVIVGLYQLFAVGRYNFPEYRLKSGQVANTEIIAPFDFPVLKSERQLSHEQDQILASVPKAYALSDEPVFDALSGLDAFFGILLSFEGQMKSAQLKEALRKGGYDLEDNTITVLLHPQIRDVLYEKMRASLNGIYKQGIYEGIAGDSVLINRDNNLARVNKSEFLSMDEARQKFNESGSSIPGLTELLGAKLIKPNILVDEGKMEELNQRSLDTISSREGMVLQNEVIVRKNSRIKPEDVQKLESLQEAYKARNLHKSAMQELLLTIGLGLFILIVVSLANHYFGVQIKEERILVEDFLPLNAGFVLLTLLSIASNSFLFINNLLIPFAMTAIAAAILVNFEFGLLYSVCNLLLTSPFLNWDTFTPIVLVLSTVMCLLMIRRQNAYHEYLMIWFYLAISTTLAVVSISIYKSDPLVTTLQSVGMGLVSATLSVGGILLIVPFYERKWNRATKQTLLELTDFNHPLLKSLATKAVGTYHHSLVVGNLSERAAEAIGANPLLARVGSYYHDIGKVINTEIFTENNEDSSEIHNGMQPEDSARMIRNHVTEGIALARKYHIPQPVIDIIMQHHGSSYIRYFMEKAAKEKETVDQDKFRYPGPLPQSKEAVLVMLADIVESTTNAKQVSSEAEISKIIDEAINRLIKEGQLAEAPITIKDLQIAKQSMLPVLESIHRKRLDYPEAKPDERS